MIFDIFLGQRCLVIGNNTDLLYIYEEREGERKRTIYIFIHPFIYAEIKHINMIKIIFSYAALRVNYWHPTVPYVDKLQCAVV